MIAVVFAVELPQGHPLQRWALPEGFPILVDLHKHRVIEPALHYLASKHLDLRGKSKWNRHSAEAEAYDLRSWFDFLQFVTVEQGKCGKDWDLANETDYAEYRDQLQDVISSITHRPLSGNTIRRMQVTVEGFYRYASRVKIYAGDFLESKVSKGRVRRAEGDALRHTRSGEWHEEVSSYREEIGPGGEVRALSEGEWTTLKHQLGPLPSEHIIGDTRFCRDRLASELSCSTGLRVDEVAKLTKNQILDLEAKWKRLSDDDREAGYTSLLVTRTKRLKPRTVLMPVYLIEELLTYINGERAIAVQAGKAFSRTKQKRYSEPETLFVNHANAQHNAGQAIRPESLSHAFNLACLAANLIVRATKVNPETEKRYSAWVSAYSFHDLRHTFAVWKYFSLIDSGYSEPWKTIQILLGHATLKTTVDVYMSINIIESAKAGAYVLRAVRGLGGEVNA